MELVTLALVVVLLVGMYFQMSDILEIRAQVRRLEATPASHGPVVAPEDPVPAPTPPDRPTGRLFGQPYHEHDFDGMVAAEDATTVTYVCRAADCPRIHTVHKEA